MTFFKKFNIRNFFIVVDKNFVNITVRAGCVDIFSVPVDIFSVAVDIFLFPVDIIKNLVDILTHIIVRSPN